ncbi:MAG TPA: hypothetical protein VGJ45_38510 [Pseudonocardiaceae bacterium]|jgi:hypothetical protein
MQPGSPYPPQEPPAGQPPYPGQPDPAREWQPGYPQGYPQPVFQAAPLPAPRRSRTGLIVLVVAAVVVGLGGGGTAAYLMFGTSSAATPAAAPIRHRSAPPAAPGRYRTAPIDCAKLDVPPYTFTSQWKMTLQDNEYMEDCQGSIDGHTSAGSAEVDVERDIGPGGLATARDAMTAGGQPLPGTGFENSPNVTYPSEFGGCEIEYLRSNEYVSADFEALPGVHDLASCAQVGLPYVQKLYALVG